MIVPRYYYKVILSHPLSPNELIPDQYADDISKKKLFPVYSMESERSPKKDNKAEAWLE